MATTVRVGAASVEVSADLQRHVDDTLRRLAPRTMARLGDTVEELLRYARSRWPVRRYRSGQTRQPHSRDMLSTSVWLHSMDEVRARVHNAAPYAYYIRSMQAGLGGRSAYVELIRRPGEAAGEALADELAQELGRG